MQHDEGKICLGRGWSIHIQAIPILALDALRVAHPHLRTTPRQGLEGALSSISIDDGGVEQATSVRVLVCRVPAGMLDAVSLKRLVAAAGLTRYFVARY